MINLTIKTLDSQNHKFRVPNTFTILEFKEFIAAQVNVAVDQQRLIFSGRVLSNETKLADIGIDGKVMHLVQKVPHLSTTTSRSSSSTTTNTTGRSGQNALSESRERHIFRPTVILRVSDIAAELVHVGGTRHLVTGNRVSFALILISKANEILNRLEHLGLSPSQFSASNVEQFPEGSQRTAASSVVENVPVGGSTNQSSAEQATGTLPSSASSEQPLRNDRQTSENRSTVPVNDFQLLRELIEELNTLNERFRPFFARHCQFIIDDPRFDTTQSRLGRTLRAQFFVDSVCEVIHFISHIYHEISDIRFAFNRTPRHSFLSRPCLLQGTNLRAALLATSTSTAAPPSTQQPNSTQTTTTSQPSQGVRMESVLNTLEREVDIDRTRGLNLPPVSSSVLGLEQSMSTSTSQSTLHPPNGLLTTTIGEIPYFRSLEGRSLLVDLFLMISRSWTLRDMFSVNLTSETSTLRTNPVATLSEELKNFILDRIMLNRPPSNQNIEDAANRIFLEIMPYINVFECSLSTLTNINVNASFRRCILQNLRRIIDYCGENRMGINGNIVYLLSMFAEGFLSLIVYCCNSRPIFRLCVSAVMQYLPLPPNLQLLIMDELHANIEQYWERMDTFHMMNVLVIDYIVPLDEAAQLLRTSNNGEQSSNPSMPSSENINEPLPEVVIGSQDWHHNVPSVPVIARRSQRQRRQRTLPPFSDAYSSGMPNKRRR